MLQIVREARFVLLSITAVAFLTKWIDPRVLEE
jgi:hypothetical protein